MRGKNLKVEGSGRAQDRVYTAVVWLLYGILGVLIVMALAVAFEHTHDLSKHVLPKSDEWHHWVNAIVAELLPTASFLSIWAQWTTRRSVTYALCCAVASLTVSLGAQLYSAGVVVPGSAHFFAMWPVIAGLLLGKLVWSEIVYGLVRKAKAVEAAERQARIEERERAEREREARREAAAVARAEHERQRRAEERAARAQQRAEDSEAAREAARRQHEYDLAALAAKEETARAQAEAKARAASADAQARAEIARAEAAARAEQARVQAELRARELELQAKTAVQAPSASVVPASKGGSVRATGSASGTPGKMSPEERKVQVQAALDELDPVKYRRRALALEEVARACGITKRTAHQFVPLDWPASRAAVAPPSRSKALTVVR